jgi:nucleolar complex protein 3
MCALITEAAHFNFRTNILASIIARLSKKSWDEVGSLGSGRSCVLMALQGSELGLTTLIAVFRADLTGQASLETVRLLNRMVKERRFSVHPAVLSCLLHLRLHSELGVRASQRHAEKDGEEARRKAARHSAQKEASRRAKGKPTAAPHLSKKTKKMKKEQKEIEEEMQEAAADVDKEEKATAVSHCIDCVSSPLADIRIPLSKQKRSSFCSCCTSGFSKPTGQHRSCPLRSAASRNTHIRSTSTSSGIS